MCIYMHMSKTHKTVRAHLHVHVHIYVLVKPTEQETKTAANQNVHHVENYNMKQDVRSSCYQLNSSKTAHAQRGDELQVGHLNVAELPRCTGALIRWRDHLRARHRWRPAEQHTCTIDIRPCPRAPSTSDLALLSHAMSSPQSCASDIYMHEHAS